MSKKAVTVNRICNCCGHDGMLQDKGYFGGAVIEEDYLECPQCGFSIPADADSAGIKLAVNDYVKKLKAEFQAGAAAAQKLKVIAGNRPCPICELSAILHGVVIPEEGCPKKLKTPK